MNIEIDNETAAKLNTIAAARKVTVTELLRSYVEEQARYQAELEEDMRRLEDVKKGGGVSHESALAHLESLRNIVRAQL